MQPVTIGTQPFLLDFVVIPLKRKGYDAILGRDWLVQAKVKHDWKQNTLLMEHGGKRFIIDLHTQMVGEEAASSDSESDGESDDEGKRRMEPDEGGVLRLEEGSNDDDLDSVNGLYHWQIEDYELFPSCNILRVDEGEKTEENECPKEYKEADEAKEVTAEEGKDIQYRLRIKKNSIVWHTVNGPHRRKRTHRTIKLLEGYRGQGKKLDARRSQAQWATEVTQNRHKVWLDKLSRFQPGQWVLKYDSRVEMKQERFKARWVGPDQTREVGDNRVLKLATLNEQEMPPIVNGFKLQIYGARKTPSLLQNGQLTPS